MDKRSRYSFSAGEKVLNNVDTQNNVSILAYSTVSLKSLLAASIEIAKRGGAEVKAIREQVCSKLSFFGDPIKFL
jgi:hypothetical protein